MLLIQKTLEKLHTWSNDAKETFSSYQNAMRDMDTRFDEELAVANTRLNRHRKELEHLKRDNELLAARVLNLESERILADVKISSMSEKLCKCSQGSGTPESPYIVDDGDDYITPPTSQCSHEVCEELAGRPPLRCPIWGLH